MRRGQRKRWEENLSWWETIGIDSSPHPLSLMLDIIWTWLPYFRYINYLFNTPWFRLHHVPCIVPGTWQIITHLILIRIMWNRQHLLVRLQVRKQRHRVIFPRSPSCKVLEPLFLISGVCCKCTAQQASHRSHAAIKPLKCGLCDWGTNVLILFNLN